MKSNESSEMYLETILVLSKRLPVVRSVDVANELGFKKIKCQHRHETSSRKQLYNCNRFGFIYLTDDGKSLAGNDI